MQKKRNLIPPNLQRGLVVLIVLLMGISVAQLLTRVHQQEERIEQLEMSLSAMHSRIDGLADAQGQLITNGRDAGNYNAGYAGGGSSWGSNSRKASGRHNYQYGQQAWNRGISNSVGTEGSRNGVEENSAKGNKKGAEEDTQHLTENEQKEQAAAPDSARPSQPRLPNNSGNSRTNKFTEARKFNLNHIDSATLIRIPGIAAATASVILRNRQRYGGFYDPWQLQDFLTWDAAQVYMQEWCTQWFTTDVADIRHIHVNQASFSELRNHPYISYNQAAELVKYRTRHKRIEKLSELNNFSSFTSEEINRLSFYLSFE